MIYERIKYEYEILENHIRRIQSELKNLPPGKPYYFLNYSGQKINNKYIYQKNSRNGFHISGKMDSKTNLFLYRYFSAQFIA